MTKFYETKLETLIVAKKFILRDHHNNNSDNIIYKPKKNLKFTMTFFVIFQFSI